MQRHPCLILLAEDDDGHAKLVERSLARAGIKNRVLRVRDGREALDYVQCTHARLSRDRNVPLVLVLDINMPRIDGVEVLRQIKNDAINASLPVIMLTTTDCPEEIERCYDLGCSVYVTKPVEHSAFVEAIRSLNLVLETKAIPIESEIV